jgi:hypothetical protein
MLLEVIVQLIYFDFNFDVKDYAIHQSNIKLHSIDNALSCSRSFPVKIKFLYLRKSFSMTNDVLI